MKKRDSILMMIMIPFLTIAFFVNGIQVLADDEVPYVTYNFDYWEDIVYTPAAYLPDSNLSGAVIGTTNFSSPQDLCVTEDGILYIVDTGNNRIVVCNFYSGTFHFVREITGFDHNGSKDTFNGPSGICISQNERIYIADTNNKRVVALEMDGTLYQIIENPQSESFSDDFEFKPTKVTVDYADRAYVIAAGVFEGIMCFDANGEFTGYSGTINVHITPIEKIWRKFSTKAQRARQTLFIPTEFTGVDIDQKGFIYATNIDSEGTQSVRRLNPRGEDVIKKGDGVKISGDKFFIPVGDYGGASHIVDVVYREHGIYSCIDSTRGRIFTYDHEGNLLYIFGGLGSQSGTFKTPVAIESYDDKILALDAQRGEVLCFKSTEYGQLINDAVSLRYDGDEKQAVEVWKKVLNLNANFELAYVGIGKAYLSSGDNKTAMKYLKLGMDREYYSIAYKRYRNEWLKEHLNMILTAGIVIIGGSVIFNKVRKHRKGDKKYE
ncbi:NHL repeat-containing protein [Anaeromicropila populeti]|uniref:NHL repeat-containing protein n=1 Tax=Anaeromicropila populeti TaxID=37658 RepID=A0A1I6LK40_9FIRM|nr:gluconolactonase [Anaeromicropila populeti]SFS03783.1 NHL repeat-containing protein [Anaeromicropila populeti]